MSDAIEIRRAQARDAAELARLAAELGYPMTVDEMSRRLTALLPDARHYVVVADGGPRLLGWMHVERRCSLEGGDRAELMGLVVDAAARRRRLGRRLVALAEEWTRAQGLSSVTVRSNTARALSHPFYEALGYSRLKTQHVYTKIVE
ncbi:MAG TPA: GNAT family N-acetyltransferase [Gammaproteobacteria bacterium]